MKSNLGSKKYLSQAAGLTLPLKQAKNITLADRSFDVANDRALGVIEEKHTDLGHITGVSSAAKDLVHFGELDGGVV